MTASVRVPRVALEVQRKGLVHTVQDVLQDFDVDFGTVGTEHLDRGKVFRRLSEFHRAVEAFRAPQLAGTVRWRAHSRRLVTFSLRVTESG